LKYFGISEEGSDGKYKTIGLELSFNKLLSKDEGRILILNCVQDILEAFNSYPSFRQYMANSPFTGDNIIVNIFIKPPNVDWVYHPDIAVFSFFDDIVEYSYKYPEKPFVFQTVEESYDEALRIVDAQRNGQLPFYSK
jgi:hypothetical protein